MPQLPPALIWDRQYQNLWADAERDDAEDAAWRALFGMYPNISHKRQAARVAVKEVGDALERLRGSRYD